MELRVSVMENYGDLNDELGEESQWGPYVSTLQYAGKFEDLEPSDIMEDGAVIEDVIADDGYLMFDVWHHNLDGETGKYLRLNFYVSVT